MEVTCSHCQSTLALPDGSAGRQAKCPRCETVFRVPDPSGDADRNLGNVPQTNELPLAQFKPNRTDAVACPGCQRALAYTAQSAGHTVICPSCSTRSQMPTSPPAPTMPAQSVAGLGSSDPISAPSFGSPGTYSGNRPPDSSASFNPYSASTSPGTTAAFPPAMPNYHAAGWGLVCAGGLSFLFDVIVIGIIVVGAVAGGMQKPDEFVGLVIQSATSLIGLAVHILMIVGGVRMTQLRSLTLVRAAAIVAMIPCFGCFLIQLPFGIWATVVAFNGLAPQHFKE